jgi:Na+/proline symporter
MNSITILLIIAGYFGLLMLISWISGRRATDNEAFFTGNRQSPWWIVAIGMVGASVSGVSFVSVPGMVGVIQFSYLQTVLGFFVGYVIIANVLLPLYYRLGLTSIYTYLGQRFGDKSYTTGASFFLLSKTIGAAARLYVVSLILQRMVFDALNVPFYLTVLIILVLIWLYTFRSGIKSIVWTDTLQTIVMVVALCWMLYALMQQLNVDVAGVSALLSQSDLARVFVFDDWVSKQHFVKQFFSGIFIAIVMTGLDQDMMQKNLTCRNLRDAKKNMYWYGIAFLPFNFLFLILGFLMVQFAMQQGVVLPVRGDEILPFFALNHFPQTVFLIFIIGMIAAAFSSADSALTALTTSFTVDILRMDHVNDNRAKRIRMIIHGSIAVLFIGIILIFKELNNSSVIDAIYVVVSYTYGPLLGMFSFGLFTKLKARDKWVPFIAVASPVICFFADFFIQKYTGYAFGYELLLLNGGLTFTGLYISSHYGNKISRVHHQ